MERVTLELVDLRSEDTLFSQPYANNASYSDTESLAHVLADPGKFMRVVEDGSTGEDRTAKMIAYVNGESQSINPSTNQLMKQSINQTIN